MSNQNQDNQSTGLSEIMKRMLGNITRLDSALDQTLQALKKRGFQLSTDLNGMLRVIRQDIEVVNQEIGKFTTKHHQLEELVRTSALINSSLEIDQVLSEVMDTVITLTGAERAYLMMVDKVSGELSIKKARNWDKENLVDEEVIFSRGIIDSAIKEGQPILTTNAQGDSRFKENLSIFTNNLRSIICIPLVLRGVTMGVLYADNRIGQGIFTQDSIPLLTAFANQSAIAIENARNFGQVKNELETAQEKVQMLQIQIDQKKMQLQLGEITDTEYFKNLQSMAHDIRNSTRRIRSEDLKRARDTE